MSPTDHLAAFYLALQLAISRQVSCDLKKQPHTVIWRLEFVSVDGYRWRFLQYRHGLPCAYMHIYVKKKKTNQQNILSEHLQSCTLLQSSAIVFPKVRCKSFNLFVSAFMLLDGEKEKSQFLPWFYLLWVITAQTGCLDGGTLETSL